MDIHVTQQDLKLLCTRLKASAKKRNIPFNLTPADLDDIGLPLTCPILGVPLKFHRGESADDSYSIDRIDSSKGYEKDNITIVSNRANKIKRDATLDELKRLVEYYDHLENNKNG